MGSCPQKEYSLVRMCTDVMWQPWSGGGILLLASHPATSPSNLLQPHLTITMQDSIYSTMSLCTHGPFPWHALERDTYTLTHMYTYVRVKRLEHTRAQWIKWKWHFLAFAAWLGCWGRERGVEKKGIFGMGVVENRIHWRERGCSQKVREMVEAGEPEKGST